MDEDSLREMLHDIANAPEPAPRIDIARARRRGLRSLWTRRAGVSVAALAVAAGVIMIPRAVNSVHPERTGLSAAASGTSQPKTKPRPAPAQRTMPKAAQFDPLVPYAAFGWLPPGYSEDFTPPVIHDGFVSARDGLTMTAAQSATGDFIQLTVLPEGNCTALPIGNYLRATTSGGQVRCSVASGQMSGKAPDVNGRPAYWAQGGVDLVWEYAPDSWAMLSAHSRGSTAFPAALARALLPSVAGSVKYGQTEPVLFPFQYSGLPSGWKPVSVSYAVIKGIYLGNSAMAGPSAEWEQHGLAAMSIDVAQTPNANGETCIAQGTGDTTASAIKDGVPWIVLTIGGTASPAFGGPASGSPVTASPASGGPVSAGSSASPQSLGAENQRACSRLPVGGLYYASFVRMSAPGASQTGGILAILSHLNLLGRSLAKPTSTPFTDQIPLRP